MYNKKNQNNLSIGISCAIQTDFCPVNRALIGKQIRKIRLEKELSQENVATDLGISKGAFSKIENGTTNVPISRLLQIATVLEVDVSAFFAPKHERNTEEPVERYGFATKGEIAELAKMIEALSQEISILKASIKEKKAEKPGKSTRK